MVLRISPPNNYAVINLVISSELCKFLKELDQRVTDTQKETKKHVPEKKWRMEGGYLTSIPPTNAPKLTRIG